MKWHFSGKQDVYLEVAERYARYIREGVLRPGEGLPSVRAVAEELGINPHTVSKAYGVLEEQVRMFAAKSRGSLGMSWQKRKKALKKSRSCFAHCAQRV